MFLLKRIALAAAMSCLSEGAIAQEGAAPGAATPAGPQALPQQQTAEPSSPAAARITSTPLEPSI